MTIRAWARYLTPLLMLASAGCATAPPAPPTVDVTGVWVGTWVTQNQRWSGRVEMTLEQKGGDVFGSVTTSGMFRNMTGPVMRGFVSGNEYRLLTTTGQLSGYLTVRGDDMSGIVGSAVEMKLHRER